MIKQFAMHIYRNNNNNTVNNPLHKRDGDAM